MHWTILRQTGSRWLHFFALAVAVGLVSVGLAMATNLGLI